MNFENISPHICKQHGWTQVVLPLGDAPHHASNIVAEFHFYNSNGRYNYDRVRHGIRNRMTVWFELEKDATYFKLKYAT